jgi:tetratricopeptide (TPR) repeat protein
MAFMAKQRAQKHYNAGTRILVNPHPSSSPQKDLAQAIKHLQKAVELDPGFAYAFHNLAQAWYTVAEGFVAATSSQKFWANVYSGKGFMKDSQDVEDFIRCALQSALDAVDQALAIRYEFPQAHNTRAMVLAKLGRLDEAIEASEVALLQAPDYRNAIDNREKMKELRRQSTIRGV